MTPLNLRRRGCASSWSSPTTLLYLEILRELRLQFLWERRLCVRKDSAVKTELLTEAFSSPFTMHPGSTKMYQNLRRVYWWRNMKREMADFINRCLVCQTTKNSKGIYSDLGCCATGSHCHSGKDFSLHWARG
ncbi:ty3-gypsy retrotransposon protein [Cucumis melo var. makuwa]|uniref:Ty3-gypsy retrotransposon protein n=1 Tax=Cucumis melo var. makuwa TaxID=1194695 RepID=A0A5D3BE94_CUCMM|nr:ty3-gypsy retrotransposon protein [Cucumis melo var. makuwa]